MKGKRGQAAMEFLMTYGWAILAAVIVIAVLASFGVFSPSKYVPTSCVVSAPWGCDENQVAVTSGAAGAGTVQIALLNGGGVTYDAVTVYLTGDCIGDTSASAVNGWADGVSTPITVTCTGSPEITLGDKIQADVRVTYTTVSGTITMTSSGSITAEAQ